MKTRIIQTRFWEDESVSSLSSNARYLWIYILSNRFLGMTNYVRIPDLYIQEQTGLSPSSLAKAKEEIQKTGKVFFYKNWVFIKNAERENKYKNSPKNEVAYLKEIRCIPIEVKAYFDKVIDSGSDSTIDTSIDSNHNSKIINNNKRGSGGKKVKDKNYLLSEVGVKEVQNNSVLSNYNITPKSIQVMAEKIESWSKSKGRLIKDWVATAINWFIGDAEKNKLSKKVNYVNYQVSQPVAPDFVPTPKVEVSAEAKAKGQAIVERARRRMQQGK